MNTRYKMYIMLIVFVVFANLTSSCSVIDPEVRVSSDEKEYSIDSASILNDLAEGKENVFTESSKSKQSTESESIPWDIEDYLHVVWALHEHVWNEKMDSWYLHGLGLNYDCAQLSSGPVDAFFIYYKTEVVDNTPTRFVSRIFIAPQKNEISVLKEEYQPQREQWQIIDLSQTTILPEEALQIAEENGGSGIRAEVKNQCIVYATLLPDWAKHDGWQLDYINASDLDPLHTYRIDPQSGEFLNQE